MNIILFEPGVRHFDKGDERAVHLLKVLHAKEGSTFTAGEINGARGKGVVTSLSDGISFDFEPEKDDSQLYPLTVILGQVRPICMRRILRELVSLGVSRLVLPVTELGEKSYSEASLYTSGEYKEILLSGAMQSGRTGVSEVIFTPSVTEALEYMSGERLLLDNVIGAKRFTELDLRSKAVTLAIGPERGWSAHEREIFISAGFKAVLMGSRILRTETAAVAGSALALEAMGYI